MMDRTKVLARWLQANLGRNPWTHMTPKLQAYRIKQAAELLALLDVEQEEKGRIWRQGFRAGWRRRGERGWGASVETRNETEDEDYPYTTEAQDNG